MAIPKVVDPTIVVPIEEPKEKGLEPFSEFEEVIYEPDISLINEYEEEEECEEVSPDNLIDQLPPDGIIKDTPELSKDPNDNDPESTIDLEAELTKPGSNEVDEGIDSQDECSEDLPESPPLSRSIPPTRGLAPIDPPSTDHEVKMSTPLDLHSYIKVSCLNFEPVPESPFYSLPFLKPSHIPRARRLLFIETTRMCDSLEPIPFALYFWYTLWHLLGILKNFSCAYQARVKPREPMV